MQDVAKAVGHIPSGLFIVCSKDKNKNVIDGYLASWIQQVSFDPLLISIAIKPGRPVYHTIKEGQVFTVNIIGEHDKSFMKHFWKGYDPSNNPFDEISHTVTESGAVLIEQAKSSIECVLKDVVEPGDHEIVIAQVLNSYVHDADSRPLTHVRKSGLDY